MTCKDCLYFKRCVVLGVELDMEHDKKADENCRHFKNKANVAEVKHGKWANSYSSGTHLYCNRAEIYKGKKTYTANAERTY